MSNILNTPTNVVKGLNAAIQPSNISLLLQLPTELLIGVVAILDTVNLEKVSRAYDSLPALRL